MSEDQSSPGEVEAPKPLKPDHRRSELGCLFVSGGAIFFFLFVYGCYVAAPLWFRLELVGARPKPLSLESRAFYFVASSLLSIVPSWIAVWVGLTSLVEHRRADHAEPRPPWGAALAFGLLTLLLLGLLAPFVIVGTWLVAAAFVSQRAVWSLSTNGEERSVSGRFSLRGIVVFMVGAAVVFALSQINRRADDYVPLRIFSVALCASIDLLTVWLMLGRGLPVVAWTVPVLVALAASPLMWVLSEPPPGANVTIPVEERTAAGLFLVIHGAVLCMMLHVLRSQGVRIVARPTPGAVDGNDAASWR